MSIFVRYYAQGFTQIYLDLLELWAGRVAGALTEDDYTKKLAQTGFNQIGIETAWLYGLARERLSFLVRGCCRQACQGARRQRDAKMARALRAALPLSSRGGRVSRTGHADPIQPF